MLPTTCSEHQTNPLTIHPKKKDKQLETVQVDPKRKSNHHHFSSSMFSLSEPEILEYLRNLPQPYSHGMPFKVKMKKFKSARKKIHIPNPWNFLFTKFLQKPPNSPSNQIKNKTQQLPIEESFAPQQPSHPQCVQVAPRTVSFLEAFQSLCDYAYKLKVCFIAIKGFDLQLKSQQSRFCEHGKNTGTFVEWT